MTSYATEESKHVHIANHLRRAIESNEYPVGTEIPSEASLVTAFDVSRGTIRQALATLRSEGLIQTTRGRRPVVSSRPLEQSIDDFFSFSSWVLAEGRTPGQRTIEVARRRRTDAETDSPIGFPSSDFVVHIVRLRLIDDVPAMIERSTFHDSIGQALMQFDPDSGSIFEYLITNGAELDEGTHVIDATAADPLDAELLDVAVGSPILRVRRITTSSVGKVLEYSEDRYRPDRASIKMRNSRANAASLLRASRSAAEL